MEILGIYGAITATAALCIGILNYRRDKARLKVIAKLTPCVSAQNPQPYYVFSLSVVNEGRRIGRIKRAGIILPGLRKYLVMNADQTDLAEAERKEIVTEDWQEEFALSFVNEGFAFVEDSVGEKHLCQFTVPSLNHIKAVQGLI